jgi:hypothetical protein
MLHRRPAAEQCARPVPARMTDQFVPAAIQLPGDGPALLESWGDLSVDSLACHMSANSVDTAKWSMTAPVSQRSVLHHCRKASKCVLSVVVA